MTYQEWRHAHAFRIPQKALEDLDAMMAAPCDSCKHCTVNGDVRSYESDCFDCSHYYGSRFEAKGAA
jgi:hypothetical protein